MKNNLLRVLIGMVTIGLLAGCSAKPENTAQQNTTQTNQSLSDVSPKIQSLEKFQSCVKTSIKTCSEESAKVEAREKNDLSWCDTINDANAKKSCQTSVVYSNAISAQDEAKCGDLSDDMMKNMCRSQIVSAKAVKAQDITLCDTLAVLSSGSGTFTMTGTDIKEQRSTKNKEDTERSEMCRMRVIQSMNIMETNEKSCEKMKTEAGKENCQSFIKTMKERGKEIAPNLPPPPQNQPK